MSNAGAAFTVRFLRNGDTITIAQEIINSSGAGAALFQGVDPNSKVVAPDWSNDSNDSIRPIVSIYALSASGMTVVIKSVQWAYDGTPLNFNLNGSTWVSETGGKPFKARINGERYELKVCGNLANASAISNKRIDYEVTYISGAHTDTLQGGADVLIQQAGSNSHVLQITTDRAVLEGTGTTATANLGVIAYYGVNPVTIGSGGYTLQWYKNTGDSIISTNTTLKVTRDDIDGGAIYICKLLLNGNVVAQDQQRINDISDEYQVVATPTSAASTYCGVGNNASYNLKLVKNGDLNTALTVSSWSWTVYDAQGNNKRTGSGATVTITPDDCKIKDSNEYADVDVIVTCTF